MEPVVAAILCAAGISDCTAHPELSPCVQAIEKLRTRLQIEEAASFQQDTVRLVQRNEDVAGELTRACRRIVYKGSISVHQVVAITDLLHKCHQAGVRVEWDRVLRDSLPSGLQKCSVHELAALLAPPPPRSRLRAKRLLLLGAGAVVVVAGAVWWWTARRATKDVCSTCTDDRATRL